MELVGGVVTGLWMSVILLVETLGLAQEEVTAIDEDGNMCASLGCGMLDCSEVIGEGNDGGLELTLERCSFTDVDGLFAELCTIGS